MNLKNGKAKKTREKQFIVRNSMFTDMFEDPSTCKLYNVYLIVFACVFIQSATKECVEPGRMSIFEMFKMGFTKLDQALLLWFYCFVSVCTAFFVFEIWYRLRSAIRNELATLFNWFGATLLILYYFYSFKLVDSSLRRFNFNFGCVLIVCVESVRFLMKFHSFVRTKATENSPNLKFSNFLYFLFAPTLIYKDSYPRTKTINWNFVTQCFLECISCISIMVIAILKFHSVEEKLAQKFNVYELLSYFTTCLAHGALYVMSAFFFYYHSLQNLFAEILCFGDRLFYLDWWNEYSFKGWLPKWNKMVQDWLYYYVYRDFKECVCDNSFLARLVVFLLSFVVHEWIMTYLIGSFFPLMFVFFAAIGFPLSYWEPPKKIIFNVLLWCVIIASVTISGILFFLERYAHFKAPLNDDPTLWELLAPRMLTCDCVFQN